jgi:cytochrome c oxidase subunit 2
MCKIMRRRAWKRWALGAASLFFTGTAWSAPTDGGIDFQPPVTETARRVVGFHNEVLIIITLITVFVMALLLWVIVRYNRRANPVPKKFSHNTLVEILWTVVPVLILVFIAYRSFPLLYDQDVMFGENNQTVAESEVVDIKVYGRQWYWSYIYGQGDDAVEYDSTMIPGDQIDASKGQLRQLSVDNPMVAPVNRYVRLSISASDVIHAWAMPQFMLKVDAVPGRLTQLWFKAEKTGVYYGQCSELCGDRHSGMPIELRILPQDQYDEWLRRAATSMQEARTYLEQVQPLGPQRVAAAQ